MGMGLGWLGLASGAQEGLESLLTRRLKEQENQRRNQELADQQSQFAQQIDLRNREFGAESETRRATLAEQSRHNKVVEDYSADEKAARARLLNQQDQDREAALAQKDRERQQLDALIADPRTPAWLKRNLEVSRATGTRPDTDDPSRSLNDQMALLRERDRLDQAKTDRKRADDPTLPYGVQDYLGVLRGRHQSIEKAVQELSQNQTELRQAHPKLSIAKAVDELKDMYGLPKGYRMNSSVMPTANAWPGAKSNTPAPATGKVTIKSITPIG